MDSRLRTPTVMYDFIAEITRPKDGEEAQVKTIFPRDYEWSEEIRKQIPKFVWPMRIPNDKEEHFTFVLTDLDSKYKFGFCRYPPKGETCMCFLSDLPWYKVFYRALDKISDLLLNHQIEVVEPFLKGLYSHPIPNPGVDTILSVVPSEVDAGQVYSFPLPNPKRLAEIPTDDNLTQFYTNLHYNVILHLFANMIFERRIIITSSSLSLLSSTVHGAVLLLYPLHWQHIFIPITPPHLLDYCAAPMPFLMGVHSSYMDIVRRMPTDDIVILDVDESTIESAHVEDLITLPSDVVSNLKHVLKKQSSAYGDTVTRSFMLAQVAMIGGYRSALKLPQGEKDVAFDEYQFLKSRPNMEEFLGQLLHFQHFRQFINSRIDKLKNSGLERDLFDSEVLAYEEELKGSEQVKAVFDKFVSSTVEGSKKFAELSGKLGGNIKKQVKQAKIVMKKNLKSKPQYSTEDLLHYNNPLMEEKKANSLPMNRPTPDLRITHGITTPPPNIGATTKPRKAPRVIPYHRHLEGKKKLAESLKQQNAADVVGLIITPPDTPRRLSSNADQTSLDRGERISLGSKSEGETAEVAVGDLIDISPDAVDNSLDEVLDSVSSSLSTASSSDGVNDTQNFLPSSRLPPTHSQQHHWERFDEEDENSIEFRPPLPPPRSELEELYKSIPTKISVEQNSATSVDLVIQNSNPFSPLESEPQTYPPRSKSPFEDFSSSIAEALITNSENKLSVDPESASTFATAGKELFESKEAGDEQDIFDSFSSLDYPVSSLSASILQPTRLSCNTVTTYPSSTGSSTNAISTTQARIDQLHPYSSILRPIPQEGTFSAESIANNTNPFFSGSVNAGNYPALVPLSKKPSGPRSPNYVQKFPLPIGNQVVNSNGVPRRRPERPPPKPQPYSGHYQQSHSEAILYNSNSSNDVSLRRRQSTIPFMAQQLPSLGEFDPFGDLLNSEGGMALYVLDNKNPSPLV